MQKPRMNAQYFGDGSLTQEGYALFSDMVRQIEDLLERLSEAEEIIAVLSDTAATQTAQIADHETRITTLEP